VIAAMTVVLLGVAPAFAVLKMEVGEPLAGGGSGKTEVAKGNSKGQTLKVSAATTL
jgi:hypothetical protein